MSVRDEYMRDLKAALEARLSGADAEGLVAETRAAIGEAFEGLGRPETRTEIEELFGAPADLAGALADEHASRVPAPPPRAEESANVAGVPYEVRMPTAERFASRMWNPTDPRLFVPRVFGLGWDLNFGALAVKLRLIRPDDIEEVPFAGVPRALSAGLVLASLALLVGALGWSVFAAEELPARVPYHFGISGPDRFAAPVPAALQLLGIPLVALVAITYFALRRRATALARGLAGASAPAVALLGLGTWVHAISWAMNGTYLIPTPVVVIVPLLALFGLLLVLNRIGLRNEWREHGVLSR